MATERQTNLLKKLLAICVKTMPGGTIPPQDELSRQHEASRTSIREALVILEFLNVIKVKPKIGTVVNAPSKWLMIDPEFSVAKATAERFAYEDQAAAASAVAANRESVTHAA